MPPGKGLMFLPPNPLEYPPLSPPPLDSRSQHPALDSLGNQKTGEVCQNHNDLSR